MWPLSSKKTYVLNRSCMDLFSSPSKDQENPFCFSIPVTYFNFLDNEKGEKFYSSRIFTYSELELLGHCLQMCLSEAIVGWMLVIGLSWNTWGTIFCNNFPCFLNNKEPLLPPVFRDCLYESARSYTIYDCGILRHYCWKSVWDITEILYLSLTLTYLIGGIKHVQCSILFHITVLG